MRRWAVVMLFAASTASVGSAEARPARPNGFSFMDILKATHGTITIPTEWDGIWEVQDSTFDCPDVFIEAFADSDTICGGQAIGGAPPGTLVPVTCTGTADANSYHVTCSGSGEIGPDCLLTIETQVDAVRTGETYRAVSVNTATFTGTGIFCTLVSNSCTRVVTEGRRLGPAPQAYCETPVRPATWGQIKVIYR